MSVKEKNSPLKSKRKLAPEGSFREQLPMFVMISPFILFFVIFTIVPIVSSIFLSFTSYDMISSPTFIGLENYRRLITNDTTFSVTVKNTFIFAVVSGPLGFLLAFMLAWLVNEFTPKIRALLSFMFYAPSLVGNAYFIWQVAFSGDSYGYINSLLLSFGIITEPIVWLKNATYGTNDWRHGTKTRFERECKGFFHNLRNSYPDTKIYAITPLWRVDIDNEQQIGEPLSYITDFIKQVATEISDMIVINGIDLVPHDSKYYQTDGVHPIDSGFEHYVNNLWKKLQY